MTKKNITVEDVRRTAELAKLELTDEEEKQFAGDLDSILEYFKDMDEADTASVKKMNHYNLVNDKKNHLRKDEIIEPSDEVREGIKSNFPSRDGELLVVKSILKKK